MPKNTRQSGIELLKIFAIFSIVVSHVVQTLTENNGDLTLNVVAPTTDPTLIFLAMTRYAG